MGLDTTHNCWHGGYGSFSVWRSAVAVAAGYRTEQTEFGVHAAVQWERFDMKNYAGDWDEIPEDPLLLLIVHSDCDGRIKTEHAAILADRLEELIEKLPEEPEESPPARIGSHVYPMGFRAKTRQFVEGLRDAAAAGEDVGFH